MSSLVAHAFVLLQYLLPRYLLTRIVYRLSHVSNERVKNFLITRFVALYDVDLDDLDLDVPGDFATFNDFFTRPLKAGSRPLDTRPDSLTCPVDGTVSAAGPIRYRHLFQAKGKDYTLHELLATNLDDADRFIDGTFATIYLAPYNYHRVHAPIDGELKAMHYVPGDLFSVNEATVARIPKLFCRNERLVCHFATAHGPAALVFVGALNVGSISTPWTGEIRPVKHGAGESLQLATNVSRNVVRGDLLGWFNMGSTVILLLPENTAELDDTFVPGFSCRMGRSMGTCRPADG